MKITRLMLASGFAVAAVAGGLIASGGPASAGSCAGSACSVDGSVTVLASITLAMPVTSFSDGTLSAGQDSGIGMGTRGGAIHAQLEADVTSQDAGGYVVSVLPGDDWRTTGGGRLAANTLGIWRNPDASQAFQAQQWTSGTASEVQVPEPAGPAAVLNSAGGPSAAGGDTYLYSTEEVVPVTSGAGAFSISLNFSAIGN